MGPFELDRSNNYWVLKGEFDPELDQRIQQDYIAKMTITRTPKSEFLYQVASSIGLEKLIELIRATAQASVARIEPIHG